MFNKVQLPKSLSELAQQESTSQPLMINKTWRWDWDIAVEKLLKKIIRRFVCVCLLLAITTTAHAHSQMPGPFEQLVYEDCPQFVTWPATVGQVIGVVPGAILGTLGGVIALPFSGFSTETIVMGAYIGTMIGSVTVSTITGAPTYGVYRLFHWDGCK